MIVSEKNKFIFIHIPRTAGTYVSREICKKLGIKRWREFIGEPKELINKEGNSIGNSYSGKYKKYESDKHITARKLSDRIGREKWKSYFKFAFVRNPWDRILSVYLKRRKESSGLKEVLFSDSKINFNIYIYLKYGVGVGKTKKQTDYIMDGNNVIVDYIGRFERLSEDLNKVSKKIDLNIDEGGVYDSTGGREYKNYFNRLSKGIVDKFCEKEIRNFGYNFG